MVDEAKNGAKDQNSKTAMISSLALDYRYLSWYLGMVVLERCLNQPSRIGGISVKEDRLPPLVIAPRSFQTHLKTAVLLRFIGSPSLQPCTFEVKPIHSI